MKIKKSKYLFFYHRNYPKLDFNSFLNSVNGFDFEKQILAIPILYGQEVIISLEEFNFLNTLSEIEWVEFNGEVDIDKLLKYGIVLSDNNSEISEVFNKRESTLNDEKWHIYSALFHFMTKWKGVDVKLKEENKRFDTKESLDEFIKIHGLPPNHFFQVDNYEMRSKTKLFIKEYDNDFFNTLLKRKTTRVFDSEKKISFQDFSTMLHYSFGIQGINNSCEEVSLLQKTSPSGGSLHPTEVFILVINVEGIDPGFYHYFTKQDELVLLKKYDANEIKEKAYIFTAGQEYTGNSAFMAFLSTRYYRNFWKYIKHSGAYSVTIRDAAHLCQNFYLIGSYLNLGVFTAAINQSDVEEELGLNPYKHGISMMVGCGIEKEGEYTSELKPIYEKYVSE